MANLKVLPIELQKIAETELGEVPNRIQKDLQDLKSWIEQQPHLNARLDEQFLIQYLRGCKYNLKKAKQKLDLFFTLKSRYPKLFNPTEVNNQKFKEIYKLGLCVPLPKPFCNNGPRLILMPFKEVIRGPSDVEELFQMVNAMHEIFLMDDPYASINGVLYIVDFKGITIRFAAKMTPNFLRKMVQFYEKSLPFRIKGIHIINSPAFFHMAISFLLSLLSAKLRQRISVYGTEYKNLFNTIPQTYLPTDMGGVNGSMEKLLRDFDKKWLEYDNYFKENANYGTNERLRP